MRSRIGKKRDSCDCLCNCRLSGPTRQVWPESSPERQQKIAAAEKWKQFQTDIFNVGSHTLTHPYLSSLGEMDARRELSESRLMLKELLNREISTFSFPYGDFNAKLVEWCRDAGYKRIFSTIPSNAFRNEEEFSFRESEGGADRLAVGVPPKILGAYRWLPFAISWKRRIFSTG